MPRIAALAAVLATGACQAPAAGNGEEVVVRRTVGAMGTLLELEVAAPSRREALRASEGAVRSIEAVEARLSTWRADSELSALNRTPVNQVFELSAETARDLELARSLWRETDGAFDPGIGFLLEAWGVRTGGRRPAQQEIETGVAVGGLAALELRGRVAIRGQAHLVLDAGAFGKGVGLDAARAALEALDVSWATLDLGGQLVGIGTELTYGLADPRDRDRPVLELVVGNGSLATSGNSERGIVVEGRRLAHIVDPRTGVPAHDFGSITVWAEDAATADALSTGLYVLGPDAALAFAEAHAGVEVVVLETAGDELLAWASSGWRGRIQPLVEGLQVLWSEKETVRL